MLERSALQQCISDTYGMIQMQAPTESAESDRENSNSQSSLRAIIFLMCWADSTIKRCNNLSRDHSFQCHSLTHNNNNWIFSRTNECCRLMFKLPSVCAHMPCWWLPVSWCTRPVVHKAQKYGIEYTVTTWEKYGIPSKSELTQAWYDLVYLQPANASSARTCMSMEVWRRYGLQQNCNCFKPHQMHALLISASPLSEPNSSTRCWWQHWCWVG